MPTFAIREMIEKKQTKPEDKTAYKVIQGQEIKRYLRSKQNQNWVSQHLEDNLFSFWKVRALLLKEKQTWLLC